MLDDIILGMVVRAATALLVQSTTHPGSVSQENYQAGVRFLREYGIRKAYLDIEINTWGPEGQC